MNKKKIIIICICSVLVLSVGITLFFVLSDKKQQSKTIIEVYSDYEYDIRNENENVVFTISKNDMKDYSWKCEIGDKKQIKVKKQKGEQSDEFTLTCKKVYMDSPVFTLTDGENDIYQIETDFVSTGKDTSSLIVRDCHKVVKDASYGNESKLPFSIKSREKGAIEITVEKKSDNYLFTEYDDGVSMSVLTSGDDFVTYIVRVSKVGELKLSISDDSEKVNATLDIVLNVADDYLVSVERFECKDFVASEKYLAQQEINNSKSETEEQMPSEDSSEKS